MAVVCLGRYEEWLRSVQRGYVGDPLTDRPLFPTLEHRPFEDDHSCDAYNWFCAHLTRRPPVRMDSFHGFNVAHWLDMSWANDDDDAIRDERPTCPFGGAHVLNSHRRHLDPHLSPLKDGRLEWFLNHGGLCFCGEQIEPWSNSGSTVYVSRPDAAFGTRMEVDRLVRAGLFSDAEMVLGDDAFDPHFDLLQSEHLAEHMYGRYAPVIKLQLLHGKYPVTVEDAQRWLLSRVGLRCDREAANHDFEDAVNLELDLTHPSPQSPSPKTSGQKQHVIFVSQLFEKITHQCPIPPYYVKQPGFEASDGWLERHADVGRLVDRMIEHGSISAQARPDWLLLRWPGTYSAERWLQAVARRTQRQTLVLQTLVEQLPTVLIRIVIQLSPSQFRTD